MPDRPEGEDAIEQLKEALKSAKSNEKAALYEQMGDIHAQSGKNAKALVCYREGIDAQKGIENATISLVDKFLQMLADAGSQEEALKECDKYLRLQTASADVARITLRKATIEKNLGKFHDARTDAEKALTVLKAVSEDDKDATLMRAESFRILGICHTELGEFKPARERFKQALSSFQKAEDLVGISRTCNNLGSLHAHEGDLDDALKMLFKAAETAEKMKNPPNTGNMIMNIGLTLLFQGKFDQAEEYLKKGLKTHIEKRFSQGTHMAQSNLGALCLDRKEYFKARGWVDKAMDGFKQIGDEGHLLTTMVILSEIELGEGNPDKAIEIAKEAISRARTRKEPDIEGEALNALGMAYHLKGSADDAISSLKESISILKRIGYIIMLARSLKNYAIVLKAKGSMDDAKAAAKEAEAAFKKMGAHYYVDEVRSLGLSS